MTMNHHYSRMESDEGRAEMMEALLFYAGRLPDGEEDQKAFLTSLDTLTRAMGAHHYVIFTRGEMSVRVQPTDVIGALTDFGQFGKEWEANEPSTSLRLRCEEYPHLLSITYQTRITDTGEEWEKTPFSPWRVVPS